jgi:hypothetical protein
MSFDVLIRLKCLVGHTESASIVHTFHILITHSLCRRAAKLFQFWLFSDRLLYGERKRISKAGLSGDSYILHRDIRLVDCTIVDDSEIFKKREFGFAIVTPVKTLVLWAK